MVFSYHTFVIHSSVEGYLDCFHVLAIVNRTGVNMTEQKYGVGCQVFWAYAQK